MLNSNRRFSIYKLQLTLLLTALFSLYSCMPQTTAPAVDTGNSTQNPSDPGTGSNYSEPPYPFNTTFVQEGNVQSVSNFTLPIDFTDAFLIRGKALSQYLRNIPTTTKICLVGKFTYGGNSDRFLIMSAKPLSFTDFIRKTKEYYLRVAPSDEAANQTDCLSYNLTNTLYQNATNPSVHFSLRQLCSNCSTAVTSSGLRLFFYNGEEVPTISVNSLIMTISGSTSDAINACVESSSCRAKGFSCCLNGQCVVDGAERPGARQMPGFAAAEEDVRLNPERFVVYPQYYFVCDSRPENGTTPETGSPIDADYEAYVRLMELKQLHDCINKVDGEFSHCTLKYTDAHKYMPGSFPIPSDREKYKDDINFTSVNDNFKIGDRANNIVKIVYAGETVYEEGSIIKDGIVFGTPNDDVKKAAQEVTLNLPFPSNAKDSNLYITYKVDGTCEKITTSLAKCTKTYIHDSSDQNSTYWHGSGYVYKLPLYADASPTANIIVKVNGSVVAENAASTWYKTETLTTDSSGNPLRIPQIVFSNKYTLYKNQTIEITYFVKENASDLIRLREEAQASVNRICICSASNNCNLRPVLDTNTSAVINYECSYGSGDSVEPPANQSVYVSNKNIAHRYFDESGTSYDENYSNAPAQDGTAFEYINKDNLKPNNINKYVGFNEIYGSFTKDTTAARPAKLVKVKKDKFYDIIVSSGAFSSCSTCGSDYYSALQKIFPQNFNGMGGGYAPDNYESRRENNASIYRPDDLLYGRACFVPATMIPWTHVAGNSPRDQRRNRLQAQHFLFANGYNRDWYGFDYGSLIGSFDGVTWFSIGNQRRIKATTNKLFLAVNAYLGDLNTDSNFNVTISESSNYSSDIPDHDTESDGAQCQKSHYCSNDNDCFRQLGYDYTCQNVSTISTPWPQFDSNGNEITGSSVRSLVSIVGGNNGQAKRCVYRGRGAPCDPNLKTADYSTTFNGSSNVGTLMCSPNNSCVSLDTTKRFNDRIARFANTPTAQNLRTEDIPTKTDTVGLGARIILRPYDYFGNQDAPSGAKAILSSNKVKAICIPGRDLHSATDTYDLNSRHPSYRPGTSDKMLGVGPTSSSPMFDRALNACPATDSAGNSMQLFELSMSDPTLRMFTVAQNMSSNLLNITPLVNQKIYNTPSNPNDPITSIGYQPNTCLRAPGASCFSDMECAPSSFIASKVKSTNLSAFLNPSEVKFWEEELVCGNPDFKYLAPGVLNPYFDIKKNKCCREYGKTITVETQTKNSTMQWCDNSTIKVAGINQSITAYSRYSRVHTVYDKMTCNLNETSTKSFALAINGSTPETSFQQILTQYKTLDTLNQRTCCTGHWVRNFASENGGGHAFAKTKMQTIDKAMFRDVSWEADRQPPQIPFAADPDGAFECATDHYLTTSCEIKNLTPAEEEKYLTWAGSLELIGIPQVAIKTTDEIYRLVDNNQNAVAANTPLRNSDQVEIMEVATDFNSDFKNNGNRYYSGANYSSLKIGTNGLKKVFSENEFNCCVPAGQEVPSTTTGNECCTGFAATLNGQRRCCLPDFTDLTVYLNRYVSSEGRDAPDSSIDPATGYIKDTAVVMQIAAKKNLCCSGNVMTGVAISQLPIPLTDGTFKPGDQGATTRRFNYRSDEVDNNSESGSIGTIFDAGVRWNNHVYCVPANFGKADTNN